MKKGKFFMRLIMLLFIIIYPLYELYFIGVEYLQIKKEANLRREELSKEFRDRFLVRESDFYKDRDYLKSYKKLKSKN